MRNVTQWLLAAGCLTLAFGCQCQPKKPMENMPNQNQNNNGMQDADEDEMQDQDQNRMQNHHSRDCGTGTCDSTLNTPEEAKPSPSLSEEKASASLPEAAPPAATITNPEVAKESTPK